MDTFETFLNDFPSYEYQRGEVILSYDVVPKCAYAIKSGAVKTYNIDSMGNHHPIVIDVKGEIFPLGWVLGHTDKTQYFYEAFTNCTVVCFEKAVFLECLELNPTLASELYHSLGNRFADVQLRIEALEQSRAGSKVVHTLRYLSTRFGRQVSKGTVSIRIPFTQQDLADFLGLTRETTSIELKKLEIAGVIEYEHQHYTLHTDKLNELIEAS